MSLLNCQTFEISSTNVEGNIDFYGKKDLRLKIFGVGGNVKLKNLSDNHIFIETSGVKLIEER